jgi:UDP-glucuronate decarboxylase
VLGAWRLLEMAQRSGAHLLQASTSEVYGDPRCIRRPRLLGPRQPDRRALCYDEGKRCAEALCFAY